MAKKTALLLPVSQQLLSQLGDRLRLARLRRRLTAALVAERAGMAPMTLRSVERGGSGVTIGAYMSVMQVLGIEKDLELIASADPLGRELQDARLNQRGLPRARPAIQQKSTLRSTTSKPTSGRGSLKGEYHSVRKLAALIKIPRPKRGG